LLASITTGVGTKLTDGPPKQLLVVAGDVQMWYFMVMQSGLGAWVVT